jgi:hypothetical protein
MFGQHYATVYQIDLTRLPKRAPFPRPSRRPQTINSLYTEPEEVEAQPINNLYAEEPQPINNPVQPINDLTPTGIRETKDQEYFFPDPGANDTPTAPDKKRGSWIDRSPRPRSERRPPSRRPHPRTSPSPRSSKPGGRPTPPAGTWGTPSRSFSCMRGRTARPMPTGRPRSASMCSPGWSSRRP